MKTRLELQYDVALNNLSNGLTEAGITVCDINTLRVKGQRLLESSNRNRNPLHQVFEWLDNVIAQRINEELYPAAAAKPEQQAFAAKSQQLQAAIRNYFATIFKLGGGPSVQEQMKKMIGTVNSFTNQVLQKKFGVGAKPAAAQPAVDPRMTQLAQSSAPAKPAVDPRMAQLAQSSAPAKPAVNPMMAKLAQSSAPTR
jgi:hypothetical protein